MEIKEINKIIQSEDKDEKSKSVKCICINYGDFLADCEGFVQKRYHDFKCNPKHQFEKKADTILENAIHEKNFMPDLFLIRLTQRLIKTKIGLYISWDSWLTTIMVG